MNRDVFKRATALFFAVSVVFSASFCLRAEEGDDGSDTSSSTATEYPVKADKISGSNIESFEILRPVPNDTVNASTFGLSVNNEDNYAAFSAALNYCQNHPNTRLEINKGVYHFKPNPSLQLTGFKNVLIEGNGAEFIFESQKQFSIHECDGLEIRNLIVDWNWDVNRVASLVQVQNKNKDAQSFEIKFLELDEVDENIPIVSFQQYDTDELVPGSYGSWKTFNPVEIPGSIVSVEKLEPNVLKINYGASFTTTFHNEEVYILRHYTYGGSVFTVGGGSRNVTFDNVSIYGSAGMGYVFGDNSNHFQVINSYIGLRPGNENKQRMSTTADGIHILNTGGYFRISGCDFSYTGDDIINIHDDMLKITDDTNRSEIVGNVTGGFVQKGDKIRIYTKNLEDIGFETEVMSFVRKDDIGTLKLKDPIPDIAGKGCYVYRSSTRTHNYVISDNYIHETKGRAALLNASDALFENNTLYRTVSECVQVRVDVSERDDKIWYEGTGARNVLINNNTFEECVFGGDGPVITIDCNVGSQKDVLSDIQITNNKFLYCYGADNLIYADNVTNLDVKNNTIVDCKPIKTTENCGQIDISGNTVSNPSATCPHTDKIKVQAREPGCYEYGSTGNTYCKQCHTLFINYAGIPPLKHKGMIHWVEIEPTCTEDGMKGNVCSLCREVMDSEVIPSTGHSYVEVIDVAATTSKSGLKHEECTICGDKKEAVVIPPITSQETKGIEGFCERLYTCALGRASDPSGVKAWADALRGGADGAKVARGFFFSPEFEGKNLDNKEYVTRLYKTFMDREPDAAGLNAWVEALEKGASREKVFDGFVNSVEWANICFKYGIRSGGTAAPTVRVEPSASILAFAERLYTTCLGRSADPSGLKAWADALANREGSGAKVAHGFFFSEEFINKKFDNGEFVRRCYLTFMDREPDKDGYDAWVKALNDGATREQVFNGFTQSPEFVAICEKAGIIAY
ncbi:MAG: DUF4214 domain-containing protein [Saccharofermentans sp.]|nr:DUF4214 domain-containing protein [Saccharofermentans sp.]